MSAKDVMKLVQTAKFNDKEQSRTSLLAVRLMTLIIIVAMLFSHLRSIKVFRWEQSVTGGIIVTYAIAVLGLALCAGTQTCKIAIFQGYLCGLGSVVMGINAVVIWQRWKHSSELTRVIVELLQTLGVQIKRQVIIKVTLSFLAAVFLLIDLVMTIILK